MTIETLKKAREWKLIEFTEPVIYQEAGINQGTNKPIIDEYRITGLKKRFGELVCLAELKGQVQKLIFDDLPPHVQNSIGMKLLSL